jgi:hypothetical protein
MWKHNTSNDKTFHVSFMAHVMIHPLNKTSHVSPRFEIPLFRNVLALKH